MTTTELDSGTFLNIGCGTHRAPAPWVNTDVVENDNTHPDLIVPAGDPLPFPDDSVSHVYLGHLLEHVDWPAVPALLADVRRVLQPGAPVLATGPDVYRTIQGWHEGRLPWWLVQSVLEHQDEASGDWPEAVHHWNCHEARMVGVLEAAGFADVAPTVEFDGWPVVNWSDWQCAVGAKK